MDLITKFFPLLLALLVLLGVVGCRGACKHRVGDCLQAIDAQHDEKAASDAELKKHCPPDMP